MSNEEHYFENLLYRDSDVFGECNKNALSKEVQEAIETCATYVKYTLFGCYENAKEYLSKPREGMVPMHVIEDIKKEIGENTKCPYGRCIGARCTNDNDCMIAGEHANYIIDVHTSKYKGE